MNLIDIKNILYNPFWGGKLIPHFISGFPERSVKIELVYLLFPFVLYKDSRSILASLKSTSTLYSAFLDNSEGKMSLAGLERRYSSFKILTNQSLIVAANNHSIEISNLLIGKNKIDFSMESDPLIKDFCKASKYLGVVFSKNDYLDIFIKLGIKQL